MQGRDRVQFLALQEPQLRPKERPLTILRASHYKGLVEKAFPFFDACLAHDTLGRPQLA
jgi:hypothetical protein